VCDTLNKDVFLPTSLLPVKIVNDERSNVFVTFPLIIILSKDLHNVLRAYLHGKNRALYNTGACFVVKKHLRQSTSREL
jgi:hypothetical protein